MDNLPNFEVVVGTYEEYLLGYKLSLKDKGVEMSQSFATHGHSSSVRCVSSSGKFLASGGADDRVVVYDMNSRKEHCMLTHHNSTVTCLQFSIGGSHLISGSSDGVLAIARAGNWQLEKLWDKPHKGAALISVAVHPTGKLALTLGADQTLRTWNLIKGRQAYAINLTTKSTDSRSLDSVEWGPCGEHFTVSGGQHVEVWSITAGGIVSKFQFKSRVTSTCWLRKKLIAIGHEDGNITILNVKSARQRTCVAHSMRVKCIQTSDDWLVSASSDGHIKVWTVAGKHLTELADCSTGCRCTSLALVFPSAVKSENDGSLEKPAEENTTESADDGDDETELDQIPANITHNKGYRVIVEEDTTEQTPVNKAKKRKHNKIIKNTSNKTTTLLT